MFDSSVILFSLSQVIGLAIRYQPVHFSRRPDPNSSLSLRWLWNSSIAEEKNSRSGWCRESALSTLGDSNKIIKRLQVILNGGRGRDEVSAFGAPTRGGSR